MKKLLFLILTLVAVFACEERPSHILSKGKMEDVLYDYHIAQAMIDQLGYEDREKMAQAYIDAVYEKNNITEEDFDSSLVYYNRNAADLNDIYKNLKDRLDAENQELSLTTGNDVMAVYSANGDTANIWNGSRLAVLRCKEGLNYESFTFNADSSFHRQDKFLLLCNTNLIAENGNDADCYINVGLSIRFKDGKNIATSMRTSNSQSIQLTLVSLEGKDIASVSGYFYYGGKSDIRNLAFVSNIGLIRMRTVIEEPVPVNTDSLRADSIAKAAPAEEHHEHLSPEEMREQNQSGTHIKIKAAPDVRTPNSFGTRRRKVKPRNAR